jgi:hypothetical protein
MPAIGAALGMPVLHCYNPAACNFLSAFIHTLLLSGEERVGMIIEIHK